MKNQIGIVFFFSCALVAGPGQVFQKLGHSIKNVFNGCHYVGQYAEYCSFKDALERDIVKKQKEQKRLEGELLCFSQKKIKYKHSKYTNALGAADVLAQLKKEINSLLERIEVCEISIMYKKHLLQMVNTKCHDFRDPVYCLAEGYGSRYYIDFGLGKVILSRTCYGVVYSLYLNRISYDILVYWDLLDDWHKEYVRLQDVLDLLPFKGCVWITIHGKNFCFCIQNRQMNVFKQVGSSLFPIDPFRSALVNMMAVSFKDVGQLQRRSFEHFDFLWRAKTQNTLVLYER